MAGILAPPWRCGHFTRSLARSLCQVEGRSVIPPARASLSNREPRADCTTFSQGIASQHIALGQPHNRSLCASFAYLENSTYLGPRKAGLAQRSDSGRVYLCAWPPELLALRPRVSQPSPDPLLN